VDGSTEPDGPAADPLDDAADDGDPADEGQGARDESRPEAASGAPLPSASIPAAGGRDLDPQPNPEDALNAREARDARNAPALG
jgi:hypothetical protein